MKNIKIHQENYIEQSKIPKWEEILNNNFKAIK